MKYFFYILIITSLASCANNNKVVNNKESNSGAIIGSIYVPNKYEKGDYDKYWIKMTAEKNTYNMQINERYYNEENIEEGFYELNLMKDDSLISEMGLLDIKRDSVTLVKCFVLYPPYQQIIDTSRFRIVEKPTSETRGAIEGWIEDSPDSLYEHKIYINNKMAAVTDTNGYFRVNNLAPGMYKIHINEIPKEGLAGDMKEDVIVKNKTISIVKLSYTIRNSDLPLIPLYYRPTWRESYRPMEE